MLMGTKSQLFFPFWAFNSWIYYVGFFSFCVFFVCGVFFFRYMLQNMYRMFSSYWIISCLRSGENQVTMHKCFFLLVFMVIILPSLGLSRYIYSDFPFWSTSFELFLGFCGFFVMFMHFFYFISALALTSCSPGSLMSTSWKRRI